MTGHNTLKYHPHFEGDCASEAKYCTCDMSALPLESELSGASALHASMISVEESATAQLLPFLLAFS